MFILSNDKDQRKNLLSRLFSFSVNEPKISFAKKKCWQKIMISFFTTIKRMKSRFHMHFQSTPLFRSFVWCEHGLMILILKMTCWMIWIDDVSTFVFRLSWVWHRTKPGRCTLSVSPSTWEAAPSVSNNKSTKLRYVNLVPWQNAKNTKHS